MRSNLLKPPEEKTDCTEDGFALLAVLGFLLILSAVLIPFASSARIRALTAGNHYDEVRIGNGLSAINALVAVNLAVEQSSGPRARNGLSSTQFHCSLGRGIVDIKIQQHSGLIDLNVANVELLQLGLAAAGLDTGMALQVAQTIGQYRRLDGDRSAVVSPALIGSEGLKYAPFEDVAELYDFPPLRSVPLNQLMQIFTVHSRSAVVSSSSLSPAIEANLQRYPEASKSLVATATQGADIYTVESIFRDGSVNHYEAGVYQISGGKTGAIRLLNRIPGQTEMIPGSPPAVSANCSRFFDGRTAALFQGVL